MKVSKEFMQVIENYLQVRANTDDLFAQSFMKEGKTIEECCYYILNKVKESGCNGFADDEIFGMAVDYYDEDDIDPKYLKPVSAKVVTNHGLTEEEKKKFEEAKAVKAQAPAKPWLNKPKASKKQDSPQQMLLF